MIYFLCKLVNFSVFCYMTGMTVCYSHRIDSRQLLLFIRMACVNNALLAGGPYTQYSCMALWHGLSVGACFGILFVGQFCSYIYKITILGEYSCQLVISFREHGVSFRELRFMCCENRCESVEFLFCVHAFA